MVRDITPLNGEMFQNWEALIVEAVWPRDVFLFGTTVSSLILDLVSLFPTVFWDTSVLKGDIAGPLRILHFK